VLSTVVRPLYAGTVGISVLLLVSVRLGDLGFRAVGRRVLHAENLTDEIAAKEGWEGLAQCCPAASAWGMQRASSILTRCVEKVLLLRVFVAKFCVGSSETTVRLVMPMPQWMAGRPCLSSA